VDLLRVLRVPHREYLLVVPLLRLFESMASDLPVEGPRDLLDPRQRGRPGLRNRSPVPIRPIDRARPVHTFLGHRLRERCFLLHHFLRLQRSGLSNCASKL